MEKRQLGNSDLWVAPLAFGGNVIGWTINEEQSFTILDAFTGSGFNLIDTADVYSRWAPGNKGGESETIIGNWMKERNNRQDVIIATKVGADMGQGKTDTSPAYIIQAVEDSLRRLQTDYIDLYQTHWDDAGTPVEETLEAYDRLVKAGKVRWIGASNLSPERLKASLAASAKYGYPKYQTFQPEYNLYTRDVLEQELQQLCAAEQISVISYYSLASGFLSGKYRTEADLGKSVRGGGITKYMNERGFRILEALDKAAAAYNVVPATIALAWLMQQVTAPIASATTTGQLSVLTAAAAINLSEATMTELNEASKWTNG